jgi:hypothetical protein
MTRSTSSNLGGRLRNVLLSPRSGFRSALRPEVAAAAARSPMSVFIVLLGGMATMALWLRVTGLVQLAERPTAETEWDTVLPALVLGAVVAALAYLVWTRSAPRLTKTAKSVTSDRLRLVWSFSGFPLAAYTLLILPLDLLLVGPEVFSTDKLDGTFAMIWSALSLALLLAAYTWAVFLFVRGLQATTSDRRPTVMRLVFSAAAAVWLFYVLLLIKELFE